MPHNTTQALQHAVGRVGTMEGVGWGPWRGWGGDHGGGGEGDRGITNVSINPITAFSQLLSGLQKFAGG